MAEIKTKDGVYKYTPKTIITGLKKIDKEVSLANLVALQKFLESEGIQWGFIFGTVLGAIREKDFISHDEDIDLYILDTEEDNLRNSFLKLREVGFELIRYDKGGIYSIMKDGEYIDFYIFKPYKKGIYHCGSYYTLEKHLKETIQIDFLGGKFRVPKDYEEYLEITYGENWQTPIEYFNFAKSKNQILREKTITKIKQLIPYPIYRKLQQKHGAHRLVKFYERVSNKNLEHLIK